jgi:D-alanine-D-alanine ligase
MKSLRILMLVHPDRVPADSLEGHSEQERREWKSEYEIVRALRKAGHEVRPLGVQHELAPIRNEVESWKPDVAFNLLEEFHGQTAYDQNVASYLELLRIPYTGCNPRGLMLARGKSLSKELLSYHRVPMPAFAAVAVGRKFRRPARMAFPLIVKTLSEDGSLGISQASVVGSDEKLSERIAFIHERIGSPAIVEQFIEGRELYVGVFGNTRLRALPVWELEFGQDGDGAGRIATAKVKHDPDYQERHGILQGPAENLALGLDNRIQRMAKRIYRALHLDGYARIDLRLSAENVAYFIEANPNPDIGEEEEFAQAALHDGLDFPTLLDRILALGLERARSLG